MSGDTLLLSAHAFAACFLAGLIWVIQVVHYPLFARVPGEAFGAYEASHMRRITWIVGPMMPVEAALAVWLAVRSPEGVPGWATLASVVAVALIWVSTATLQGPMHARLSRRHDAGRIRALVRTNWIRTALWTGRGVLAVWMLAAHTAAGVAL